MKKVVALPVAALVLAACGGEQVELPNPDPSIYSGLSCSQLAAEAASISKELEPLEVERAEAEEAKKVGMAAGVLLSPLGGALISGNANEKLDEILPKINQLNANHKGVVLAGQAKGCWE